MMPDGSHNKKADVFYFILNRNYSRKTSELGSPKKLPLPPIREINIDSYPKLDLIKDKNIPIYLFLHFEQINGSHSNFLFCRMAFMGKWN